MPICLPDVAEGVIGIAQPQPGNRAIRPAFGCCLVCGAGFLCLPRLSSPDRAWLGLRRESAGGEHDNTPSR